MLREHTIALVVDLVEDEVQQIEPRNEGRGQVNVARDRPLEIVLGSDRVGSSEDRGARVERSDDTRLGDRDGLLFLQASC